MTSIYSRRLFIQTCISSLAGATILTKPSKASITDDFLKKNELIRRIRFHIRFHNPLAQKLPKQKFWLYLPLKSEKQTLQSSAASIDHHIQEDHLGHQILEIIFHEPPGHFDKTVKLEVGVRFNQIKIYSEHPQNPAWLKSEQLIESDSMQIAALANKLRHKTDKQTIEAIYIWVSENIQYAGFHPEELGAKYALNSRRGDCTEYSYLVAALARANKIPARVVGGYFTDHDIAPRPTDYHNWTEVFVDRGWNIVDAQKGLLYPRADRYVAFRIHHRPPINNLGTAHRYRIDGQLQADF